MAFKIGDRVRSIKPQILSRRAGEPDRPLPIGSIRIIRSISIWGALYLKEDPDDWNYDMDAFELYVRLPRNYIRQRRSCGK